MRLGARGCLWLGCDPIFSKNIGTTLNWSESSPWLAVIKLWRSQLKICGKLYVDKSTLLYINGWVLVKIKINLARKGMNRVGSMKTTRAMWDATWACSYQTEVETQEVGGMNPVPFKREKGELCQPLSKPWCFTLQEKCRADLGFHSYCWHLKVLLFILLRIFC